jgi:Uma2 family endonuclease
MATISRLTLGQYDRMIAAGVFAPRPDGRRQRIELIEGELRDMSPIGPVHEDFVDQLAAWSMKQLANKKVRVRIQNSIGIPALDTAPEPDLVWVPERSYASGRPTPKDVLLIIEVADSSLDYDTGEKAEIYATAGIADYWVVNIPDECVHIYRNPERGRYRPMTTVSPDSEVRPLAFPDIVLPVTLLFGDKHSC